jgi:SAM-dependent methyltransferase
MKSPAEMAVIWHDVECGSYEADLPLWERLAEESEGPILELGCGTGRVALHLARRGHRVIGIDRDHDLVLELAERSHGLLIEPLCADALDFELEEQVGLALAPMQFLQLLHSPESRARCLKRVAAALRPGGLFAVAILRSPPATTGGFPPPDVREIDGWAYSSLPTMNGMVDRRLMLRRLRQAISPQGELVAEEADQIELCWVDADELRAQSESAGFALAGYLTVSETETHVGSVVVLLERSA